jgi:hypothetical protein
MFLIDRVSFLLMMCDTGPDQSFKVFDSEDVQQVLTHCLRFVSLSPPRRDIFTAQYVDLIDKDEISEGAAAAAAPATAAEGMQE